MIDWFWLFRRTNVMTAADNDQCLGQDVIYDLSAHNSQWC